MDQEFERCREAARNDGLAPLGRLHCLTIIGQIEGHAELGGQTKTTKYEHVLPLLASVEESPDVDGLLILLNTVGGDVEAGLAIAELISGMSKPTVSLVLGGGHSIGVPLAVSARRCFIAPSASMTLHPVRLSGTVMAIPQTMAYFRRIEERVVGFICAQSRVDPDVLRSLMRRTDQLLGDVGSVVCGREAVELGLCDAVGGLREALDCLRQLIREEKHGQADADGRA
ncbi:MAG: peptidase S14 [Ruminococcaceae bacterium]|nr:peptidase S14 [Oscillospiraceae bacterium]